MPNTQPPETIEVDAHADTVGCDGGGGALGHPMVYYSFGTKTPWIAAIAAGGS